MTEGQAETEPKKGKHMLAKQVGILAILASAVAQEYGTGINFVSTKVLTPYPGLGDLVPLVMLVTGIALFPKIFMFQKFARHASRASAEYVWIGRTLSPSVAFIMTFIWWVGLVFAIGVVAFSVGSILASTMVALGAPSGTFFSTVAGHIVIGLAVEWSFFGIHFTGVRTYGIIVSILLFLVFVAAIMTIIVGFMTSPDVFAKAVQNQGITIPTTSSTTTFNLGNFLGAMVLFVFAYAGLSAAPLLGGETKDASKKQPVGIVMGWIIAMILYTIIAFAVFHVARPNVVVALINSNQTYFATVPGIMSLVAPKVVGDILTIIILVIVIKTMLPQLLSTSRLVFGWGEDRVFPPVFGGVNRYRAPVYALFLSAALGSVALIEDAFTGFVAGVVVRSISVLLLMAFVGFGVLAASLRKKKTDLEEKISTTGMKIAAILAIAVMALLVGSVAYTKGAPIYEQPLFTTAISAIIGGLIYFFAKRNYAKQHPGEDLGKKLKEELPID